MITRKPGEVSAASASFASDARALTDLKARARDDPRGAARAAAVKFEAVFLQQMLTQMRQAMPGTDAFSSDATRLQTSLYDQTIAEKLAQRGTGLADMLARHIERALPKAAGTDSAAGASTGATASVAPSIPRTSFAAPQAAAPAAKAAVSSTDAKQSFVSSVLQHAEEAAKFLGVPASFVVGQAALESGWGKREIAAADGTPSFNLFGIKAGAGWNGKTVAAVTTEVIDGVAHRVVQTFRAYESYAEGFADYARLLAGSPRYAAGVVGAADPAAFAGALAQGGYATDPAYAQKLTRAIASVGAAAVGLDPTRLA